MLGCGGGSGQAGSEQETDSCQQGCESNGATGVGGQRHGDAPKECRRSEFSESPRILSLRKVGVDQRLDPILAGAALFAQTHRATATRVQHAAGLAGGASLVEPWHTTGI